MFACGQWVWTHQCLRTVRVLCSCPKEESSRHVRVAGPAAWWIVWPILDEFQQGIYSWSSIAVHCSLDLTRTDGGTNASRERLQQKSRWSCKITSKCALTMGGKRLFGPPGSRQVTPDQIIWQLRLRSKHMKHIDHRCILSCSSQIALWEMTTS